VCNPSFASYEFHDVKPLSFLILFLLFVVAVELNERNRLNGWEIAFMVYSLGFCLEKVAAMQEHGIRGNVFHVLLVHRSLVECFGSLFHGNLGMWRLYITSRKY
jgi:hypothetical protein